jgi:hypothetical protein
VIALTGVDDSVLDIAKPDTAQPLRQAAKKWNFSISRSGI